MSQKPTKEVIDFLFSGLPNGSFQLALRHGPNDAQVIVFPAKLVAQLLGSLIHGVSASPAEELGQARGLLMLRTIQGSLEGGLPTLSVQTEAGAEWTQTIDGTSATQLAEVFAQVVPGSGPMRQ